MPIRSFGRLTALEPIGRRVGQLVVWCRRCDCGNTCAVTNGMLNAGKVKSCGCLLAERRKASAQAGDVRARGRKSKQRPPSAEGLTGQRFGRLAVIRPVGAKLSYALWECRCDCGKTTTATGNARSCGCLRHELRGENLAGRRFGDLVAAEPTGRRENGSVVWRCLCDCGRECEMSATRLKRLKHPTCGRHSQ